MKKIQRTSEFICRVLSVLFWVFAAAGAVAVLALGAVLLFAPQALEEAGQVFITLGFVRVELAQGVSAGAQRGLFIWVLLAAAAATVFGCYSLRLLRGVFRPMAKGMPFDAAVSATLKKLAWVQLIFGAALEGLKAVIQTAYFSAFDVASLFDAQKVAACRAEITMDGTFVIIFILLMLLAHVFRYGEELQQLADETL